MRNRKKLSKVNYLELIPTTNISHKIEKDGLVVLMVPKFRSKIWSRLLNPSGTMFIYLHLDENGSHTWLKIDGKATVQSICTQLEQELGQKIHPVEERVPKFMTQLYLNKYIRFTNLDE